MEMEQRARVFLELSKYTGRDVTADFIKRTLDHLPALGLPRIHSLFEGIYKPAGDKYALCIYSRSAAGAEHAAYPDALEFREDGSWIMLYSPKRGSLDTSVNRALMACQRDHIPVLVIVKIKQDKRLRGERYRILGAAFIEEYRPDLESFVLRGGRANIVDGLFGPLQEEERDRFLIRNRVFSPFALIREDRTLHQYDRASRERAFRSILLEEYGCLCAVCKSKFILRAGLQNPIIEAEAAHIIPVKAKGPDDPRNGLSLCRRHHWAFDLGLFTVTDAATVKVSPRVQTAIREKFDLEEYEGEALIPPVNDLCRPHETVLHWHQKESFLR